MNEFADPTNITAIHIWLKNNSPEWMEYEGIYPLSEIPPSCPWQFEPNIEIGQIIDIVFRPIKTNLSKTVQMLKERCQSVFALLYQDEWYLLYVLQITSGNNNSSVKILGGGKAATTPQLSVEVSKLGWTVPNELKLFYQVHNGLGDFSFPWRVAVWDTILLIGN